MPLREMVLTRIFFLRLEKAEFILLVGSLGDCLGIELENVPGMIKSMGVYVCICMQAT